jgi:hypothetical protein
LFQRLTLKYEEAISKFSFKFNLRRFNLDADAVCNNILVARTFTHEQAGS